MPKEKETTATLLNCSRDIRATVHPRIGVRINPEDSEAEVSMREGTFSRSKWPRVLALSQAAPAY
jgi:hypothetical protein